MNYSEINCPAYLQAQVDEVAQRTVLNNAPLRVCLVGGFSVGKSSLINMLLQEKILPTAIEETTALPTFIEYGAAVNAYYANQAGTETPLSIEEFQKITVQTAQDAAYSGLKFPAEWLKNATIIDLPGTGSNSAANREYTIAQIKFADVILYLLANRGPSQDDINTLRFIQTYGKRVKIMVTHWDSVEEAIQRGEKAPNLEAWAENITEQTGLKARLAPTHQKGLGREEIVDFFARSFEDLQLIRSKRFAAELQPLIENALGQNAAEQAACVANTEAEIQANHTALLAQKAELLALKTSLYQQKQDERQALDLAVSKESTQQRQRLDTGLQTLRQTVQEASHWDAFLQQGSDTLNQHLVAVSKELSDISAKYGKLTLPAEQIKTLNLRIPAPEAIDANAFLDIAKLEQLTQKLTQHEQNIADKTQQLSVLPEVNISEQDATLDQLYSQRNEVSRAQLPTITTTIPSSGMASKIGRFLGEAVDIALIFVPGGAVAKGASIAGKAAKAMNIGVKAKQISNVLTPTLKTMKAAQGLGKMNKPAEAASKLGMLEMLSFSYWGEKVGTMFDGPPQTSTEIDPEALAEQQQALQALEQAIAAQNREVARLEDIRFERELQGNALAQSKQEQAKIEDNIHKLRAQAVQKQAFAREQAQLQQKAVLQQYLDRASRDWLISFDQQSRSMVSLLNDCFANHWEKHISQLIEARLLEIENYQTRLQSSAAEKQKVLHRLQEEQKQLTLLLA